MHATQLPRPDLGEGTSNCVGTLGSGVDGDALYAIHVVAGLDACAIVATTTPALLKCRVSRFKLYRRPCLGLQFPTACKDRYR